MNSYERAIKKATREQYGDTGTSSDAEAAFAWQIKHLSDLPVPQRGLELIPGRNWAFDFAWPDRKIIVEIEGGVWRPGGGAHSRPLNILRDMAKYNAAAKLGYRVFRFTPDQVKNHEALEFIKELF